MPSLTHTMIACQPPKLERQIETAVWCYCRAETICSVLNLNSDLKRILPRLDDLLFFMQSKASADLSGFFPSSVTNEGIGAKAGKREGGSSLPADPLLGNVTADVLYELIMSLFCLLEVSCEQKETLFFFINYTFRHSLLMNSNSRVYKYVHL